MDYSYDSIVHLIKRIIPQPVEKIYVYLHYEQYFLQVRFLYYSKSLGWLDNDTLVDQKNYYLHLTIIHAYVSLIQKEEHPNHVITIYSEKDKNEIEFEETIDYWHDIYNAGLDIDFSNKAPMAQSYSNWKERIIGSNL